jgi:hypothetical protein
MRLLSVVRDLAAELLGGYASGFFMAGFITYSLDYINQVLIVLMLTVAYVLRAPQVTGHNYAAFLVGYFTASAVGLF